MKKGFTLIELVIVITIIGIIAGVAVRTLTRVFSNANFNGTIKEMDVLAEAMVGNPDIIQNNIRTNFGYVGDTGQMPPTLQDLVSDVSTVSGWDGPYVDLGFTDDADYYLTDAWGNSYVYTVPTGTPTNAPTIYTIADNDPITKNIATSLNAILNNTVKYRLYNENGVEINGSNGDIDINYAGSWHSLAYSSSKGFVLSTVPIGIWQLRALSAGDTTYKSISVGLANSTTGSTGEMTVYPNYGTLTYVASSVSVQGGADLDEIYFDVSNTGSATFIINSIKTTWTTSGNCWNCKTPYLWGFDAVSTTYWKWDTNGRSALVPSESTNPLDSKLYLYTGTTTIGPITFEDAVDGAGNPINMEDVDFEVQFGSGTAPTQTITFTSTGSCLTPTLSLSSQQLLSTSSMEIIVSNSSSDYDITVKGLRVTTNLASGYLDRVQAPSGSNAWLANNAACSSVPRVNIGAGGGTVNFTCTYSDPVIAAGSSQTFELRIYDAETGTTGPLNIGDSFTIVFDLECGSDQSIPPFTLDP